MNSFMNQFHLNTIRFLEREIQEATLPNSIYYLMEINNL
jgi:hypothetical protein